MAFNIKKVRSFDSLMNFSSEEINYLVDQSIEMKKMHANGLRPAPLKNKMIVSIFEKNSTRTANATARAADFIGVGHFYNGPTGSNMGDKESVGDTGHVFGEMYDLILYRTFGQEKVDELVRTSGIPVINGLSDQEHPTQTIADLQTIKEHFGSFKGLKVVFVGDYKNNMGASWMFACAFTGMDLVMCGPSSYEKQVDPKILKFCKEQFAKNGGSISFCDDKIKAAKGAHIIATDVWVSLGEPFELWEKRIEEMHKYQVDEKMMLAADPTVVFMHCLPAFHDINTNYGKKVSQMYGSKYPIVKSGAIEVSDEVFSNEKWNISFKEAGNRWTSIAAIMYELLK